MFGNRDSCLMYMRVMLLHGGGRRENVHVRAIERAHVHFALNEQALHARLCIAHCTLTVYMSYIIRIKEAIRKHGTSFQLMFQYPASSINLCLARMNELCTLFTKASH